MIEKNNKIFCGLRKDVYYLVVGEGEMGKFVVVLVLGWYFIYLRFFVI